MYHIAHIANGVVLGCMHAKTGKRGADGGGGAGRGGAGVCLGGGVQIPCSHFPSVGSEKAESHFRAAVQRVLPYWCLAACTPRRGSGEDKGPRSADICIITV